MKFTKVTERHEGAKSGVSFRKWICFRWEGLGKKRNQTCLCLCTWSWHWRGPDNELNRLFLMCSSSALNAVTSDLQSSLHLNWSSLKPVWMNVTDRDTSLKELHLKASGRRNLGYSGDWLERATSLPELSLWVFCWSCCCCCCRRASFFIWRGEDHRIRSQGPGLGPYDKGEQKGCDLYPLVKGLFLE